MIDLLIKMRLFPVDVHIELETVLSKLIVRNSEAVLTSYN